MHKFLIYILSVTGLPVTYQKKYSCPCLISPPLPHWKSGLSIGMAAIEGDNLEVFYYLEASENLVHL